MTSKVDPRAVRVDLQTKFEGELSITIIISAYIVITLILLIMTIVVFNLFYQSTKSLLLTMKYVSEHHDLQIFVLKLYKYE